MEELLNKLAVTYRQIYDLRPQEGSVKLHPRKQVEKIAESIKLFGFNDPIGISSDGTIVEGHGRYEAAKLLGLSEVPTINLDHLTEEERKAYSLVHNELTMFTGFDMSKLKRGLSKIGTFDLRNVVINDKLLELMDHELNTNQECANMLNLGYTQFPVAGNWDIPEIQPVYELPEGIEEWIGFNCVISEKSPENKGVHFFIDEDQFERVWHQPDKFIPYLRRYKCVLSPDFRPYGDMPLVTQLYNHYRKHCIAAYWQQAGITVIPTIRANTDPRFMAWYLDGEPQDGVVAVSTMWVGDDLIRLERSAWDKMIAKLRPRAVVVYGEIKSHMTYCGVPLIEISKFTDGRWRDRKESKVEYPVGFHTWPIQEQEIWIQETYGDDTGELRDDTPEEIRKLYDEIMDYLRWVEEQGIDL